MKRKHDILDIGTRKPPARRICGIPSPILTEMTTSTTTIEKVPSANLENVGGGSKPLSKGKCLTAEAKGMMAMTMILEGFSEARDNLLVVRLMINHAKARSVEISIIKQVVDMGVIIVKEGQTW